MMTITSDKLAYVDKLKASGISEDQAQAQAGALDAALRDSVATKSDLIELKYELIKWLVPLLLGQAALIAAIVKLL
jgi:hypothetical protein